MVSVYKIAREAVASSPILFAKVHHVGWTTLPGNGNVSLLSLWTYKK
jgi:hypothetical protein